MCSTRRAEWATMEHRATESEPITEPIDAKRAATLARMEKACAAKDIQREAGAPDKPVQVETASKNMLRILRHWLVGVGFPNFYPSDP